MGVMGSRGWLGQYELQALVGQVPAATCVDEVRCKGLLPEEHKPPAGFYFIVVQA
jgi:hypothetical protein